MKYYRMFIWKTLEVETVRLIDSEEKSDNFHSQYVTRPFKAVSLHGRLCRLVWQRQRGKEMMCHCTGLLAIFTWNNRHSFFHFPFDQKTTIKYFFPGCSTFLTCLKVRVPAAIWFLCEYGKVIFDKFLVKLLVRTGHEQIMWWSLSQLIKCTVDRKPFKLFNEFCFSYLALSVIIESLLLLLFPYINIIWIHY